MQREKNLPFLKITLALPSMVSVARGVLEKGMIIPGLSNTPLVLPTFESNVLFILRFMVDCKVWRNVLSTLPLPHTSARLPGDRWKLGAAAARCMAAHQAPCVNVPGNGCLRLARFTHP
jgi:hypothetical protein